MKIVMIGAGNVAFHLGPLFIKKGHTILQLYNRSKTSGLLLAKKLKCSFTNDLSQLNPEADIYIVMLKDELIGSSVDKILFTPDLIVHTSGSTELAVFPKSMKNSGVMYPLQTFSKIKKSTPERIPFCIEASNKKSLIKLRQFAKSLNPLVYELKSSQREIVHLSAVFANNFTNHLFAITEMILKSKRITFDILKPLIEETISKIQESSPEIMQTGPAVRGDSAIIKKHIRLLKQFPEAKDIYTTLSKSIGKVNRKRK